MDEAKRRQNLGDKLRKARIRTGLSIADVCKLIRKPGQKAALARIENPASAKSSPKQKKNGHSLDILMLEDLARLYGENLEVFVSQPRAMRLRTRDEILRAAASEYGIRATRNGGRIFTITPDGAFATIGSQFKRLAHQGLIVAAHRQKNVIVYRAATVYHR